MLVTWFVVGAIDFIAWGLLTCSNNLALIHTADLGWLCYYLQRFFMVLHPSFPGLKVEIVQSSNFDQPLKEYQSSNPKYLPSPLLPCRYVEATSDASFGVRCEIQASCFFHAEPSIVRPTSYVEAYLLINGNEEPTRG
jgi:hypothetical protein